MSQGRAGLVVTKIDVKVKLERVNLQCSVLRLAGGLARRDSGLGQTLRIK